MRMGLYTIFDRLAEQSGPVFEAANDAVANRQYKSLMDGANVGQPQEYQLFKIGYLEHGTCVLEPISPAVDVTITAQLSEVIK